MLEGYLQVGSRGILVKELQLALCNNGVPCAIDGIFGPLTEKAVKVFQAGNGLVPDGIAGPLTRRALAIFPPVDSTPISTDFFDDAFSYTLGNEGEYSNHPSDGGGPTRWGVIQIEYSRYIGHPASIEEMQNLPIEHAKDIYKNQYWNALGLDGIEARNVAIALFDRAVLNGLFGSSKLVRQTMGIEENGRVGFKELFSNINLTNPVAFVMRLADFCEAQHRARVAEKPNQRVFLPGWLNRVNRMRRELGDGTESPV